VEVGAVFKFPRITNYIVAKPAVVASVRAIRGTGTDLPLQQTQDKHQCVRHPEELGELADEAGSRLKGMSNYRLDLDEKKLYTRNKTEIAQREEDLGFLFRAMD
jgi:hypothetical protein